MRIIAVLIFASCLSPLSYGASVVAATTGDPGVVAGNQARAVYNLNGNALAVGSGYIGIGYFSSLPDFASASASIIQSSFVQFGASDTFGVEIATGVFSSGLFSATSDATILLTPATNTNFIGQNIFVVMGNGASIGSSTGLLVLRASTVFGNDDVSPFSASLDLQTGTGLTVLHGSNNYNGSANVILNFGGNDYFGASNSYQMAALIPEPSSLLLASLSLFGFVLRRKR